MLVLGISCAIVAWVPRNALADRNDCKWRQLDVGTTKPAARRHMALVYDAYRNRVILHGGEGLAAGVEQVFGDVWALEWSPGTTGPNWVLIEPGADPVFGMPAGRFGHAAAYVPGDSGSPGRFIFHGGKDPAGVILDDTWELSLGGAPRWKRLSTEAVPTNRWHHTGVFFNGAFHIFGGNPVGAMADLWRLDPSSNTWSHLGGPTTIACRPGEDRSGTPEWPNRRYYHSHIVDTNRNMMVVYGGDYESECIASNMYETGSGLGPGCERVPSTTGTWNRTITEGQQGDNFSRILHGSVFDPIGQRMITVGGYNPVLAGGCLENALGTVAAIGLPATESDWYELHPAGAGPAGIAEHGMVYDPQGDRVILFGGVTGDSWSGPYSNTTWAIEFDRVAPGMVADLDVQQVLPDGAILRWTAPGDDQSTGTAFRYEIRYSAVPITDEASFASATLCAAPPVPAAPGQEQTVFIPSGGGPVFVALKTWDESDNVSHWSNLTCFDIGTMTDCDNLVLLGVDPGEERRGGSPEFSLRSITPNPSSGVMTVGISLARRGDAVLEVVDVAGRRVAVRDVAGLEPGPHSIVLGSDVALAPGYYLLRLRQAGNAVTKPVVVR